MKLRLEDARGFRTEEGDWIIVITSEKPPHEAPQGVTTVDGMLESHEYFFDPELTATIHRHVRQSSEKQ